MSKPAFPPGSLPPYQHPPGTAMNPSEGRHGAIVLPPEHQGPDRAVILQEQRQQLPAGFTDSASAARMMGVTVDSLKTMRSRKPSEDRGPRWFSVNGWRVAYRVEDVQLYVAAKAAALKAKADTMLAAAKEQTPLTPDEAAELAAITGKDGVP